jgi:hypothetical protein
LHQHALEILIYGIVSKPSEGPKDGFLLEPLCRKETVQKNSLIRVYC